MNVAANNAARQTTSHEFRVCANAEEVASAAADLFIDLSAAAIRERGRFRVALSGGSTPKRTYQLLAERGSKVDWEHVDLFWGDERYVPADDPQSNFRMTSEALLHHVPIPPIGVHRIRTEVDSPEAAAQDYEREIGNNFRATGAEPRFDLAFLGLGTNGHTASLFPNSGVLHEKTRLVVADFVDEVKMWRITMTAPLLNAARTIAFLVAGQDKAEVVHEVAFGPKDIDRLPAQLIQPTGGKLLWILDESAARLVR
jgi:6-phosphogluconolactonase